MQRQQPVLTVDGAQNPFPFGYLQYAERPVAIERFESQRLIARNDDGPSNRGQVPCLTTLLVVLDEFVDLAADDLTLVRLIICRDAALEQVPVDLRWGSLPPPPDGRLGLLAVTQDLESHELVDVAGRERGLIELNAKLLHANRGNVDHRPGAAPPLKPCTHATKGGRTSRKRE